MVSKETLLGSLPSHESDATELSDASTTASIGQSTTKFRLPIPQTELMRKNDYAWLALAMVLYFAVVGALAAAVKLLGETWISRILLLLAGSIGAILCGVAVTRQGTPRSAAQQHWTIKAVEQLPSPGHRLIYYGLCTALTVSLFYTTGLSFLIVQFLKHAGCLPGESSWAWVVLFPMRSSHPPTTGAEVLELGKGLMNDLPPFAIMSILLEAFTVCRFLPEATRPRATYNMGDAFLSIMVFVLPLYLINTVMIDWGQPVYNFIHDNFRVTDAFASDDSVVGFWLCLVAADYFYYAFHRSSHIMSWLWTSHSVHHSSEGFNLTNGPREGTATLNFTPGTLIDVIPLAFFFPFSVANPTAQVKLVWQFWFHAVLAPPWPTLELLFNSPSLHRVHHAKNEDRLGKNYGAIFSVWDRIFGTYEPELRNETDTRDDLYYGIIPVLHTWDAVWLNIQPWHDMFTRQVTFNGWAAPLLHWTPPTSKCPKLGSRLNPKELNQKYPRSWTWFVYAFVEMVVLFIFGLWISFEDLQSVFLERFVGQWFARMIPNVLLGLMGCWSLSSVGKLMEGESYESWQKEVVRHIFVSVAIAGYMSVLLESPGGSWELYLACYGLLHAAGMLALWRALPKELELG